jgi:Chitobiase/beta-hexosaminidase C-terminal domain
MKVSTHGRAPTLRRRRRAVVTAAAGIAVAAAFAAPAGAANPPTLPHSIISFPERDFVSAEGYEEGVPVLVEVLRNGSIIGTSTEVMPGDDPTAPGFDGIVEVNHPGGGCWVGSTPDIRPGDEVRTTQLPGGVPGQQDATTTANVKADAAVREGSDVVVRGTAFALDGTTPLPLDQIEQRIIAGNPGFANGRRRLQASSAAGDDGLLQADIAAGPGHWIVRYQGLSSDDQDLAVASETRILWLGADALAANELTIFEVGEGVVNGPSAPCTAPSAETSLGGTTPQVKFVNSTSVHQDMVVSGLANDDITTVDVSVGGTALPAVSPSGSIPNRTWSVTVPKSVLENAPQGDLAVTASFVSSTNTAPQPQSRTLVKDTVLPAAPTATPGPGSYAGPQTVSLASADQSAAIHYTVDGSTPTALSRRFDAPLSLTASQTIRAVAVDPAGNESAPATLPFTILPASAGGGGSTAGGTNTTTLITQLIPVVAQPSAAVAGTSARAALRVSGVTLARRISITRARSRGLTVSMTLPRGTQVVRLAVYRSRNGLASGRPLVRVLKLPTRSGRYVVNLRSRALLRSLRPGRYSVQVTPGRSLDDRGRTSSLAFTITP